MERPEPETHAQAGTEPAKPPARDRAHQRWHIDRDDTEALTATQHDHAVTLLADLLTAWTHRRHTDNGERNAA
ncbi:hypothetical protein LTV02_19125 [Nocardia yamanashiensis]|uniref:hypothetical protein n=1 Tax=Nocardia yamanashiensis TaxID=209247 RepID=UPI001E414225|nr:hypothetical protein [Nocardia yamanashiensis]UGT45368.1 hypothetical protein LTV02_19125 [Nocardia yamanashiensis]